MLAEVGLFLAGMALLLYGADRIVEYGSLLARYYGISTFFIGITIVAVGTSIPEMATSIFSALYGAGDIVVGNIIGSETAQITLAIGIVALIAPVTADRKNVMIYGGGMIVAMVIMILTLESGTVTRFEGLLMMLAYSVFLYFMYTHEAGEEIAEEVTGQAGPRKTVPWMVVGVALVAGGGHLMVTNGIALARVLAVPEFLIGLLTGLGTTLPEIIVAGTAAWKGDTGISAGSLLGSNITDPLFSLGIGALAAEVAVTNVASVMLSATYMLVVSVVVIGIFFLNGEVSKREAVLCILLYLPGFALF